MAVSRNTKEKLLKERVNLLMKTRKMRNLKRTVVAGLAAFMMLAESVTAFAAPVEEHVHDEGCACCAEHDGDILYEGQFVDEDGNVTPVSGVNPRLGTICPGHKIVSGYFQTHVKDGKGGCVVKTYYSTRCIYCDTIWVGDLFSIDEYVTCPHTNIK